MDSAINSEMNCLFVHFGLFVNFNSEIELASE